MSTLVGIDASCALVKWNSELAKVIRANKKFKVSGYTYSSEHLAPQLKVAILHAILEKLTFAALLLVDVTGILQVIERKDVLHLCLGVYNRTRSALHACLNLLAEELLHIVWLFVRQQCCQVLHKQTQYAKTCELGK